VVNAERVTHAKVSLTVRLSRKVSHEELETIARSLRKQEGDYKHVFMTYYLPEMAIGAGAWATTHFNPTLDVQVLGLSAETEKRIFSAERRSISGTVLGTWIDEQPFVASRITIREDEGQLFMDRLFKDGSSSQKRLLEQRTPSGRRFANMEPSPHGDHFILTPDGTLEIRDHDGLVAVARTGR
jgi:hypothetical protein